jgi:hypothetical protein
MNRLRPLTVLPASKPPVATGTVSAVRTDCESIKPALGSALRPSAARIWPRSASWTRSTVPSSCHHVKYQQADRRPRREVLRQLPPSAAGPHEVEDRVHDPPPRILSAARPWAPPSAEQGRPRVHPRGSALTNGSGRPASGTARRHRALRRAGLHKCSPRVVSGASAVPSSPGSGMTLTTKRMTLRARPGAAVMGESRAQSRSADNSKQRQTPPGRTRAPRASSSRSRRRSHPRRRRVRLVPDGLWKLFRRVVPPTEVKRPQGGGRRRAGDREALAAIIFVATSGCTWRQLPPVFCPAWQTVYRRFAIVEPGAGVSRAVSDRPR